MRHEFQVRNQLFHDGCPYPIKTSPLICRANQWTGFYMIRTSVMKDLRKKYKLAIFDKVASLRLQKRLWHWCFPVNFAKFLGNFFYRTALGEDISESNLSFKTPSQHLPA